MWVCGYRAEEYAPPVGRGGHGLLQSACAWQRAPRVAVGAWGCYGVRYRVHGEGPYRTLMWLAMMLRRSATRAVRLSP